MYFAKLSAKFIQRGAGGVPLPAGWLADWLTGWWCCCYFPWCWHQPMPKLSSPLIYSMSYLNLSRISIGKINMYYSFPSISPDRMLPRRRESSQVRSGGAKSDRRNGCAAIKPGTHTVPTYGGKISPFSVFSFLRFLNAPKELFDSCNYCLNNLSWFQWLIRSVRMNHGQKHKNAKTQNPNGKSKTCKMAPQSSRWRKRFHFRPACIFQRNAQHVSHLTPPTGTSGAGMWLSLFGFIRATSFSHRTLHPATPSKRR